MRNKVFYGWIITAAGCVIMAVTMGIVTNCNSLYIRPVAETLGISRQAVSLMISILNFGTMGTAFLAGRIFNEKNIIRVMKIAITIMVITYFANSFAKSIYFLYITYFINGIMMCLVTTLPITFLINNWFIDRAGFALGLASMGSGFGGALFNALAGQLMSRFGWVMTYRVLSLFILVLAVPCIFFVLKLKPADMGLEPYMDHVHEKKDVKKSAEGLTFSEARKTSRFRILCVLTVLIGISMNSMYSTISPHLQDQGYSLTFSANFLSICMLMLAGGKIVLGRIFDRFGVRFAFCWACASLALALVGMLLCRNMFALVLLALGVGFGCIFGAVVYPLSVPLIFGRKDYRAIVGPLSALVSLGGVIGPVLAGRIYDMTGSYNPCYLGALVIMIIVILVLLRLLPGKDEQYRQD